MNVMPDAEMTLGEMARSLQRIELKLDTEMHDHEARLRKLEQWMWATSALASAGAFSGLWAWIEVVVGG